MEFVHILIQGVKQVLDIKNLKTIFKVGKETVTAVDDVSFSVEKGKVIGLVGESGSGKTVTAMSILNLLPDNAKIESGEILFNGEDLLKKSNKELQLIRGRDVGLIFQNPLAALNPVFTVGEQIQETILLHRGISKKEAKEEAISLLKKVNIPDPEVRYDNYPHEFSLGMCQRAMIAMTLSMKPKLLIADEPTASLDVTVQAQILELLGELTEEYGMSVLMISHDLGVIAQYCDEVMVMYLGSLVEKGSAVDIFKDPKHPYTQALLSSIPIPDPSKKHKPTILQGDIPSPLHIPSGCRFHPRCPQVKPECSKVSLSLKRVDNSEVACVIYK
ncbi:peptide ABC transporter ATP-binding protein [Candidatus Marinamargulisbacteria bacterium SCGC AAA071-K20]|nr:peptide ABC transporter ATP-binding protein [Candidatus Marinamargulisbacteria bacterium SCGC AAA071-K20]